MILVAYGTRPEHLKIEPLLKYWKSIGFNDWKIWLTGQHEEMCNNLEETWEFRKHIAINGGPGDYTTPSNRLDGIIHDIMSQAHHLWMFGDNKCDAILVQGDTASAFACALAAFHRKIPIIHLEAGLRSYDNENPYPEEFYRRSISMMSSINLCPTEQNRQILQEEMAPGKNFVVGNTSIDNIKNIQPGFSKKILCTLHRRENQSEIKEWFDILEQLAGENPDYEFILPIHPNPQISKYRSMFQRVMCVDAMPHDQLINILKDCYAVITDSGGIAEESTYFGKRVLLCRKATERPEGEAFYTWCETPTKLKHNCTYLLSLNLKDNLKNKCPFGDGNSSKNVHDILTKLKIV